MVLFPEYLNKILKIGYISDKNKMYYVLIIHY